MHYFPHIQRIHPIYLLHCSRDIYISFDILFNIRVNTI